MKSNEMHSKDTTNHSRTGNMKIGTVPSVPRELGKSGPAGKVAKGNKDQSGSMSKRSYKIL